LTYYDVDGNEQTVDSSNYRVNLSQELQGELEFIATWTAPSFYDRADAISLQYTAGYQTRAAVPRNVVRAMKILISLEFDDVPPNREANARLRAKDCLTAADWGAYR
jgi:hypothetical protein